MKKFLSNIIALCAGVFAFLALIMPAVGHYINVVVGDNTTTVSGYDFISFEDGVETSEIMFSVFAIILMVVACLLILVSVIRFFADNKKFKLAMIQNILACVLAVLAIATLICAIAFVGDFNNSALFVKDYNYMFIGIGSILNCVVLVVCAILTFLFNCGKKKKR